MKKPSWINPHEVIQNSWQSWLINSTVYHLWVNNNWRGAWKRKGCINFLLLKKGEGLIRERRLIRKITANQFPVYHQSGIIKPGQVQENQRQFNPLSPESDQHQICPCNINALLNSGHENYWHDHTMNLLDILSTSPHYFCRKWIGATNENSNFDLRV